MAVLLSLTERIQGIETMLQQALSTDRSAAGRASIAGGMASQQLLDPVEVILSTSPRPPHTSSCSSGSSGSSSNTGSSSQSAPKVSAAATAAADILATADLPLGTAPPPDRVSFDPALTEPPPAPSKWALVKQHVAPPQVHDPLVGGGEPAINGIEGLLLEEKPSTLEEFVAAVCEQDLNESRRLERNRAWEQRSASRRCMLRPILFPRTRPKRAWDRLVSCSVLLHLLGNPLLLAFSDHLPTVLPIVLLLCDGLGWLDICLTFVTAIEETTGNHFDVVSTICSPRLLAEAYLSSHFALDLLGALPYYWIVCRPSGHCIARLHTISHPSESLLAVDALLPTVVLLSCLRVRRIMRTPSEAWLLFLDFHTGISINKREGWQQLGRLVLLFLYLSHVAGCLYWYVSVVELDFGLRKSPPEVTWLHPQDYLPPTVYAPYYEPFRRLNLTVGPEPGSVVAATKPVNALDIGTCYLYILVWGMLNISGANILKPQTIPQTAVLVVVVLVSIMANAVIIGSITNNLSQMASHENEERQKRRAISVHMRKARAEHQTLLPPLPIPASPRQPLYPIPS
jgi:hypothetical protein